MAAQQQEPITDIRLKLVGEDGNAFMIMGRARQALRRNGRADLIGRIAKGCTGGRCDRHEASCGRYPDRERKTNRRLAADPAGRHNGKGNGNGNG